MNKAVFLDRDGTINVDKNYVHKIEDFEFIHGVKEAIKAMNDKGYLVIVVTNQAGIARGYYTEEDMIILHNHINDELKKSGAHIDAFYHCPHHPEHGIGKYRKECDCRKPNSGMFEKAIEDYNIDIAQSFMIGDKTWDVEAAINVGISGCLVKDIVFDKLIITRIENNILKGKK